MIITGIKKQNDRIILTASGKAIRASIYFKEDAENLDAHIEAWLPVLKKAAKALVGSGKIISSMDTGVVPTVEELIARAE
jgi:hypothetical protein